MKRILGFAAVSTLVLAATAAADSTVTVDDDGVVGKIYITPENLRMDDAQGGAVIFDAKANVLRVIEGETYYEITKADLEKFGQMASGAMAQYGDAMAQAQEMMKEQMKNMTPEQRAMVEKHMKIPQSAGAAAALQDAAPQYIPLNKTEKINGHSCKGYKIMKGGAEGGQAWVASPKDVGIQSKDMEVFHHFVTFMKTMPSQMGMEFNQFDMMDPKSDGFLGVPVKMVDGDGVMLITNVSNDKIDSKVFKAHEGLTKKDPMAGMGGN